MMMKADFIFLGAEQKVSGKTQKTYFMIKLMDMSTSAIYEFYTPETKGELIAKAVQTQMLSQVKATLKLSSYQGKAQVDLETF